MNDETTTEDAESGDRIRERLRDEIRALETRADDARAQLEAAPESGSEELTALVLKWQAEIAQKEADLKLFEGARDPPLTDPQVFGWEATQGLVEYELIAGKDTLVRVFVGARPPDIFLPLAAEFSLPSSFHFADPYEIVSRLDYATLEVKAPNGSRFRVPATMSGEFSAPSQSEEDNVNFYIAGDQLSRVGKYEFVARFYREGELVGTNALGSREFLETGDFRLLIKVNTYPMSDAGWDTVLTSLEYLQRNLPVRAGVAPMDSDLSAGLRFYIDPDPYDPGFSDTPKWGNAHLALSVFNLSRLPWGNADHADMLMSVREQQPNQPSLPGSAEGSQAAGGGPGVICGVQLRRYPPGDGFFATVVSQEIGHNLIPLDSHTQTEALATTSAFDLLNRKALPEVHTVMYGYVRDGSPNEMRLFEPAHWSKMRKRLLTLSSSGPASGQPTCVLGSAGRAGSPRSSPSPCQRWGARRLLPRQSRVHPQRHSHHGPSDSSSPSQTTIGQMWRPISAPAQRSASTGS